MGVGRTVAIVGVLAGIGYAVYGYFEGVPESDIVYAVRGHNLPKVKQLLERDPRLVHVKVYPQAYERASQRLEYETRHSRSPWEGKYLIHEAADNGGKDAVVLLDMLAAAGADARVRRKGRTLLHDAADSGNVEVATWLIDRGADVNARNDCSDSCAELGWTPLHNAQYSVSGEMSELLLTRGAAVDQTSADGRSALHVAAQWQAMGGAFVLCRYGADPARADAGGQTPRDRAEKPMTRPTGWAKPPDDPTDLPEWLKPDGGCAKMAALARRTSAPVPDDDARRMYIEYSCARGNKEACAQK
jgi:hypothetical protein